MNYEVLMFPFGEGEIKVKIPKRNLLKILKVKDPAGLSEEIKAMENSFQNSIGSKPLCEVVDPYSSVALVISDITRPVPNNKIVPCIIDELNKIPVPNERITIVVATGMHRSNTEAELESMLGKRVLEKVKVINHDAFNEKHLTKIGYTSAGTPLEVNSIVADADIKITTGYIEPHEFAGFTGGRKSILPGVSGINAIKWNHRPEMLSHPNARIGVLRGNPIHEDMVEAAKMLGVDFIVNVILNSKKEITKVVAGDLVEAHLEGVKYYKQHASVRVDELADIVIASSGYPLDRNLYQSVKSIIAAEPFVKENGTIVLLTECRDGVTHRLFYEQLKNSSSPDDLIERIKKVEYSPELDHCYLLAKILKKCNIIIVSPNTSIKEISNLVETMQSVEKALNIAFNSEGREASVLALPFATRIVSK